MKKIFKNKLLKFSIFTMVLIAPSISKAVGNFDSNLKNHICTVQA